MIQSLNHQWNKTIVLVSVFMFLLLPVCQAQYLGVPKIYHKKAIDIALKATGLDKVPDILVSARREILAFDNTPLLHERIVGRPLWRVTIDNVTLTSRYEKGKNPYIHAFDVLIDAQTGQVLKVISLWPADTEPKEEVRALISTQEYDVMFRGNDQCFPGGIPEDLPQITFLSAVEKASGEDFTIITDAKQIEGIYVMFSPPPPPNKKSRPAWVIIHHGFPPFRIVPPPVSPGKSGNSPAPTDARTVAFNVIDATTGERLLGGRSMRPKDDYQRYMK